MPGADLITTPLKEAKQFYKLAQEAEKAGDLITANKYAEQAATLSKTASQFWYSRQ